MKSGSKRCPFCGSRFTFEEFELVDSMPADVPCLGCERLYAILAASALDKASKRQPEPLEAMDLSLSAISERMSEMQERLRVARQPEAFDYAKAAAGDRD